jgi:hypothetical protein
MSTRQQGQKRKGGLGMLKVADEFRRMREQGLSIDEIIGSNMASVATAEPPAPKKNSKGTRKSARNKARAPVASTPLPVPVVAPSAKREFDIRADIREALDSDIVKDVEAVAPIINQNGGCGLILGLLSAIFKR